MVIAVVLVAWISAIFVAQAIGSKKGHTMAWLWGFFLSWVGVLIVALMSAAARRITCRPSADSGHSNRTNGGCAAGRDTQEVPRLRRVGSGGSQGLSLLRLSLLRLIDLDQDLGDGHPKW